MNKCYQGHGKFKSKRNYIVVHHSATNDMTTFEKILSIERERNLFPTYHAVVDYLGFSYNFTCLTDIGWHVKAGRTVRNSNSLGICFRSEERRVGKECRSRWSPYH